MTVQEAPAARAARLYLEQKASAWAAESVRHEREAVLDLLRFVEDGQVHAAHVVAYVMDIPSRRNRKGEPWSAPTVVGALGAVRRFLRWAHASGYLLEDLSGLIVTTRVESLPRTLTEAEVDQLIERTHDIRARAVLELLYGTGLRASEVVRLDLTDVDLASQVLCVREGKGKKGRVVPFGARAREALRAYLRQRPVHDGALFIARSGRRFHRSALGDLVRLAGRRAGLTPRGISASAAAQLRHASAEERRRHPAHPGAPGPRLAQLDAGVPGARGQRSRADDREEPSTGAGRWRLNTY